MVLLTNRLCSFGGGGCVWSWFTWLEQEVWALFPHVPGLMSLKAWSRAWCSCNLTWDFLLLGWWVGDSNACFKFPTFIGRGWRPLHTSLENCCSKQACRAGGCESLAASGRLCQTQLPPLPAPRHWPESSPLPLDRHLVGSATISVAGCGQPPALQWDRCTLQHLLIPVSSSLKAGDEVSYIGLTSERAFWTPVLQPMKCSARLEVPVEFPLSC